MIDRRRIVVVGRPDDVVTLQSDARFVLSAKGEVFAASTRAPGTISVYDSGGRFTRTVGRPGQGPGEFASVTSFAVIEDELYVLDVGNRRLSVFSTALELRRTIPLGVGPTAFVVLKDRRIIASVVHPRDGATGGTLAMLDPNGGVVRAFDPESTTFRGISVQRTVAPAVDSGFWSAAVTRYAVRHWSSNGVLLQSLERRPSWFEPWTRQPEGIPAAAPLSPMVLGVREDPERRLWVQMLVPDRNWKAEATRVGRGGWDRYIDTLVEIIDPRRGVIVASQRFDEILSPMDARGYTASSNEDPDGFVSWTIWRLELRR